MIERKKYGITPLSALGKEKYISGAADSARQCGTVMAFIPDLRKKIDQISGNGPK